MEYRNWIIALALISLALFMNQDRLADFLALLADQERFSAYVASLGRNPHVYSGL